MRQIVLISTFFLSFITSYSQVQLGIKGGLNFASVKYIEVDNSKARLGWNAGLLAEVPIQENLLVRPELVYSSKGFGFSAIGTSSSGSVRLNYINVPLLFGYRFNSKTEFLIGPEFGFLTKAVSRSLNISDDRTDFYRHFDIGFDLGLAYKITKGFGAEVRYNYGFRDLVNVVYPDAGGGISGQGKDGANRVFQVGLFYLLGQ